MSPSFERLVRSSLLPKSTASTAQLPVLYHLASTPFLEHTCFLFPSLLVSLSLSLFSNLDSVLDCHLLFNLFMFTSVSTFCAHVLKTVLSFLFSFLFQFHVVIAIYQLYFMIFPSYKSDICMSIFLKNY